MSHIFRFCLLLPIVLGGFPQVCAAQKTPAAAVRLLVKNPAGFTAGLDRQTRFLGVLPPAAWTGAAPIRNALKPDLKVPAGLLEQWIKPQLSAGGKMAVFPGRQTVDAVIFDLDGTLLDSLNAWDKAAVYYLRGLGIEPPPEFDQIVAHLPLMEGALLAKRQFNLPLTPEEILEATLAPVRKRYLTDIPAKPGVPAMIRFLHAQGIKLCIATASDGAMAEAALKRLGLWEYFDFLITCDEVGVGKNQPAVYEAALARLGTQKARTLVVEDALHALQTAKRAGFRTAAIADEYYEPKSQVLLMREADYYIPAFDRCRFER